MFILKWQVLNPFENNIIAEPITAVIPEVKIEVEATPIVEIIEEELRQL